MCYLVGNTGKVSSEKFFFLVHGTTYLILPWDLERDSKKLDDCVAKTNRSVPKGGTFLQ